ncbi:MAG: hypothetical protein V3S89_05745, partial [Desulfobacterales bacterium]
MNLQRIGIAVFIVFIVVISVLVTLNLSAQEKKNNAARFFQKGYHLVNLVAVYPLQHVDDEKRNFFLRIISEYASEGLAYLYIHDLDGRLSLPLSLSDVSSRIPGSVVNDSLQSIGYIEQTFIDTVSGQTIHEFARPIFEGGSRTGTIRLGFQLPEVHPFSLQRISLLAMITFFIISALVLGYYGITHALKPIRHLTQSFKNTAADSD